MRSHFSNERGMTLFEALIMLALISVVSAAAISGVIRLPASLVLQRELSRLEAEMALASIRAQRAGDAQSVSLEFDPPLKADDCSGGDPPTLWFKPNGDVNFVEFCLSVRDETQKFQTDWLTGRLVEKSE